MRLGLKRGLPSITDTLVLDRWCSDLDHICVVVYVYVIIARMSGRGGVECNDGELILKEEDVFEKTVK